MSWSWTWTLLGALLALWLLSLVRRRVGRSQGRSAASHPYHCVVIRPGGRACDVVRSVAGVRFLALEAPSIPLSGCGAKQCRCVYVHFDDRRNVDRRAMVIPGFRLARAGPDMRGESRGRRRADLLHPYPRGGGLRRLHEGG